MSTVARIELYHVGIPLPAPFYPSWIPGMPQTKNHFTLIKVITDDGVVGYSAGTAMGKERSGMGEWKTYSTLSSDRSRLTAEI